MPWPELNTLTRAAIVSTFLSALTKLGYTKMVVGLYLLCLAFIRLHPPYLFSPVEGLCNTWSIRIVLYCLPKGGRAEGSRTHCLTIAGVLTYSCKCPIDWLCAWEFQWANMRSWLEKIESSRGLSVLIDHMCPQAMTLLWRGRREEVQTLEDSIRPCNSTVTVPNTIIVRYDKPKVGVSV